MKHLSSKFYAPAIAGASILCLTAQPISAAVLHNGWQYAIDVSYDSLAGDGAGELDVGGTIYETYGFAIKDDVASNTVWVGINGNLPITGRPIPGDQINGYQVPNGNIGWGDLLFDFVDGTETNGYIGNYKVANDNSQLFGVRFARNNDSGVSELGLYSDVSGIGVTQINAGWSNLEKHNDQVSGKTGLDAWMGNLRWSDDYYQDYNSSTASISDDPSTHLPSNIGTGTKVADVTLRSQAELEAAGFDLGFFFERGAEIFGFSFEKPIGFRGDFIATLLSECINDGAALLGKFAPQDPLPPLPPLPSPFDNIDIDECPVTVGQIEALLPDEVQGEYKLFYDVESHNWYDPPPWQGFEIVGLDGTLFTQILDFSCGVSANDKFKVFVGDLEMGDFEPGESLNFLENGGAVESFKVVFEDRQNPNDPDQIPFSIPLAFNKETGSFFLRPLRPDEVPDIPEPSTLFGLLLISFTGWKLTRLR
ncbi:MAG: hypothetical protein F6K04_20710 [Leptolyngbya sp. SIO4C5]|nr:hypothetical protein [Leptolyngbya sp. SIO4C5]